ncbi:MAG TPA: ABC transporter ATP-binding protein [bacterium (Candidatus Stahlbacteria)]|nr:ABC transporter ATP-binding protein [Candidatus Stahlbacteria bacterium]
MIEIKDLTLRFGSLEVFKGLNLEIEKGEHLGVCGRNGRGKTSLLYLLKGIIPNLFSAEILGKVQVMGRSPGDGIIGQVGIMIDEFEEQVTGSTVEYEIAFPLENLRLPRDEIRKRIDYWLSFFGLDRKKDQDPWTLSGGELQRLVLATVLATGAEIILLDEPTSNLDFEGRRELRDLLNELNKTAIVADHDPMVLCSFDRVLHLGPEPEIVTQAEFKAGLEDLRPLSGPGSFPEYRPSREAIIQVRDLKKLKGSFQLTVDELKIGNGELVAIAGRNGAGKTTLARLLAGIDRPDQGKVEVRGSEVGSYSGRDRARIVSYLYQNPDHQLFASRVIDEVLFGVKNLGLDEGFAKIGLETVGLSEKKDLDPFLLPKGDRQLVALASTLALRPEIIIFDEPTTGLDYPGIIRIMGLIKLLNDRGHTIIIITHALWIIEHYIPRVIWMESGRIVDDLSTREFMKRYA